jgi:PAS domain S-box-containing protein
LRRFFQEIEEGDFLEEYRPNLHFAELHLDVRAWEHRCGGVHMVDVGLGSAMADGGHDGPSSGDEVAGLRRRVAELERANERLSRQMHAAGGQGCQDFLENLGDSTPGRDAQQRMSESEEKLRALFNAVTESIMLTDVHGTLVTLNETAAQRLGHSVAELIGRRPTEVAPSLMSRELAERREAVIRKIFETGQAAHFEDERAGICFETSLYPVFDARGRVAGVAIFAKDISGRKRLEQKLQESEERYRTVVESAGETIAVVDAQGVFQFLNTTAARRLGGRPADLVGKTMWDLFPREIADRQMGTIRKVLQTTTGVNTIVPTPVGGESRWYNTTIEPLKDSAGTATAALVVARDIHELRTAQQELETYREKMIRAEHLASLGTLSAMVAHEMTQPLTVIRLSLQNAMTTLAGASPPSGVWDDLRDALTEISDMAATIQRFRDFAGRTADKPVEPVSLATVARKVLRTLEPSARASRVALEARELDDLPLVRACARDLEQVFFALAQNAIQAADGRRNHTFRIHGTRQGDSMELRFTDDCGGIAPEAQGRLFEPFFTTKPLGEGTGLGLCVVERLVSQADGHIQVDSQWGQGTTFTVTLPIVRT